MKKNKIRDKAAIEPTDRSLFSGLRKKIDEIGKSIITKRNERRNKKAIEKANRTQFLALREKIDGIGKSFIDNDAYVIDVVDFYDERLRLMEVAFVTKTEKDREEFLRESFDAAKIEYESRVRCNVDPEINIEFMVLSREVVEQKYSGVYYYAMH